MTTFAGGIFGLNQIANPQVHSLGPEFQADSTAQNPIGGMIRRNGQLLRYVKVDTSDVAPTSGAPAYASVFTPAATATALPVFTVTADQSDSVMGLQPVGVFLPFTTAPTNAYYIWIAVGGKANVIAAGSIAGQIIIGSSSDSAFALISDGSTVTNVPVGRICGTSAAGLSPALLMNMDW